MTDLAIGTAPAAPADDRKAKRNALVLAGAGALLGAIPSIVFVTAPLAAYDMLGNDGSLATLPITAFVVGTACGTVPAALLMRRVGRRPGLIAGCAVSAAGSLFCALAMFWQAFALLCLGTFLAGFAAAFVQQYRFAAADTASPTFRPRAISWVLVGGVAAAVIGPQTVIYFGDLFAAAPYAGAYWGAVLFSIAAAGLLAFLDIPRPGFARRADGGRPLGEIVWRPGFLVAVGCATSAYALMSFVMTAAPLAMVLHGHHRDDAVLAIQWHAIAMFGPSFFTGSLIARFGAERIVAAGLLLLVGCALVALAGASVGHFWLALILLGLGWNFGFIGGTALVTHTYRPEEKEKVQALNDFVIFGFVALASFSSGEMLMVGGWDVVNIVVLPVAAASLAALFWRMWMLPRAA
jgi:MFS family permease